MTMKQFKWNKKTNLALLLCVAVMILVPTLVMASAAGGGLPWEGPLDKIQQSLSGPVAKAIALICVVTTGSALAFGEGGGAFRSLLKVVFGLSVAFGGMGLVQTITGSAGGLGF